MNKLNPHFRIVQGNAFIACVPMYYESEDGTKTPIAVSTLTDVQVEVRIKGGEVVSDYEVSYNANNGILLNFASGIGINVYSVVVSALHAGRMIRTYYAEAFEGVDFNRQSTLDNFITDGDVTLPDSVFVLSADTSAIAELTTTLQEKVAEAEAAKEEWESKAAELDGVAQEQTLTEGVSAIRQDIGDIDFDKSDLAKQGTNASATNTAIMTAIGEIDIDTTELAKQGSDATISLTTMDAKLGNVVMMASDEYEPALADLDTRLDNLEESE